MKDSRKYPRWFFSVLIGLIAVIVITESLVLRKQLKDITGKGLNRRAWQASYKERGLTVPPDGKPREGFWGVNLSPVRDPQLDIILPERHVPGMFEIDRFGRQYARSGKGRRVRILILGGSVAAGAYASSEPRTYFHQLAERLGEQGHSVEITVQATGAWTSLNELNALRYRGLALKPDYVIFFNGLNDLTLNRDLSEAERVRRYLERMRTARDLALAHGIKVIFAPQPFLPDKRKKTPLEVLISVESYRPISGLVKAYNQLRQGLNDLTLPGKVFYMDCSNAFSDQTATTFADIWHFSDPGHALLGQHMAEKLDKILPSFPRKRESSDVNAAGPPPARG